MPETTEEEYRPVYYSVEDVTRYFCEIAIGSEYYTGDHDDGTVVRKWMSPVKYWIYGDWSEEDAWLIESLFTDIENEIPSFPGARRVDSEKDSNLTIGFIAQEEFQDKMGEYVNYDEVDGCVTFWFDIGMYAINSEIIGYNNGMDPANRRSVILEEIYNGLGLVNDTDDRMDSIVYQYGSVVEELSPLDWGLLYLLYLPDMKCGMDGEECAAVIAEHYEELKDAYFIEYIDCYEEPMN